MHGVHYLLQSRPLWLTALLLYFVTIRILHYGRSLFEGKSYNVALSSEIGDIALIFCVLIGIRVLNRVGSIEARWLQEAQFQTIAASASMLIGLSIQTFTRMPQVMDRYHNVVIVPLFLYLLAAFLPITYLQGTATEKVATIALILFWLSLVVFDIKAGRMDQRKWLSKHGIILQN